MIHFIFFFLNNFVITLVSLQKYVKVAQFGLYVLCEFRVLELSFFVVVIGELLLMLMNILLYCSYGWLFIAFLLVCVWVCVHLVN
jgi:hypothetical protein